MLTFANVKSWDNPYYSQLTNRADGYLTWSESMWGDIKRFHQVGDATHHVWGPRPFCNFFGAVKYSSKFPNAKSGTVIIGYAAAFCDTLMAASEVKVLARIADGLKKSGVDAKILFRPYPTMHESTYSLLHKYSNIQVVDIAGPAMDRYRDGREIIRFGSDEERIQYLSQCHLFLSIATSFTFEAALFGMPVIQYMMPKNERLTDDEVAFFGRLDISDHILNYFIPYLPVISDIGALVDYIKLFMISPSMRQPPFEMLDIVGFMSEQRMWSDSSKRFIKDMRLE
jgi:hypothetical protein